jgi:hypothetical protein
MPPRGVSSAKRARQYEHIKESAQKRGRSTRRAKQIAAATVNKQRRQAGETRGGRKRSGSRKGSSSRKRSSTGGRKRARSSRSRSSQSRSTSRSRGRSSSKKR